MDDSLSLLLFGIWFMAAGMYPLGFMFGVCSRCCKCANLIPVTIGVNNPLIRGWGPKPGSPLGTAPGFIPFEIFFSAENSANCFIPPLNNNRQYGEASNCFVLQQDSLVRVRIEGTVEKRRFGVDKCAIFIDDEEKVSIESFDGELGNACQLAFRVDQIDIVLSAGRHTYKCIFDTVDNLTHVQQSARFIITIRPNPLP